MTAEPDEEIEGGAVTTPPLVDHFYCGVCYPRPIHPTMALCGTSLLASSVVDGPVDNPCIVCCAGPSLTCNQCGTEILTCPPS